MNLTQATGRKDSLIFAIFVSELSTLCLLGLKLFLANFSVNCEQSLSFPSVSKSVELFT